MNHQQAKVESERCLQCFDAPCAQACPTNIEIPKFIGMISSGNILGAAEVVKTANAMANTCGKICPQEVFCQSVCTRAKQDSPVNIRELHFFATQVEQKGGFSVTGTFLKKDRKVAVIGAGPSGLTCALELCKLGYAVDLIDSGKAGGVPRKSIPSFRLSNTELESDTRFLSKYFRITQKTVDSKMFKKMRQSHDAVFLAVGLGEDRRMGIPGERLKGLYPVLEFLERAKSRYGRLKIGKHVVVVGGGNVSLDAAATAKRLGAESVIVLYRRSESEMRVWRSELEEARKQGVEIRFLTIPASIQGKKKVEGIKCRPTILSKQKDKSGRQIPLEVKGSDFILHADNVIIAIGQKIKADWLGELKRKASGYVAVDKDFKTSIPGIFAGGDMVGGEGTIVQSVAQGKHAAHAIHNYLSAK
jgi:NADPH-dependent glutamate synthase beta subunit-like oxidoreductase